MLARAAAESGDIQTRNAAMITMWSLRQHGITPPNMMNYVLERMKVCEQRDDDPMLSCAMGTLQNLLHWPHV